MSIPARVASQATPHRHLSEGVTPTSTRRDHAALLVAAAANPTISDRAKTVYMLVVALDQEVTAAQIAAHLPHTEEDEAAQVLGRLASAGLLSKRLRTIGYKDGRRVRRGAYTLAGGAR